MLEKLSNINQNLTLRQVIEGGATSSLQVYAPKFAHVPASPCLTGWSSCIFALEVSGNDLVRQILEQDSSIGENVSRVLCPRHIRSR